MTILRRPTASAVHIAGRGGIHQDQPRYIDVVFGGVLLRRLIAPEASLVGHIGQEGFENVGIVLTDQALGVVRPLAIGILRNHAQRFVRLVAPSPLVNLLDHVDELFGKVTYILRLALFQHGVQNRFKGFAFRRMGDFFGNAHSSLILSAKDGIDFFI